MRSERRPGAPTARIGMIVPSSNTCLEPSTYRMLGERTDVTVHFTRIPVTRVALDDSSDDQFEVSGMEAAAALLAAADVDVIAWNGTAGSWLGTGHDRAITDSITSATGVRAITSTQAFMAAFSALGVRTVGLVTPYTDDVNNQIIARYRDEGITVTAAHGFGVTESADCAQIPSHDLLQPTRQVAQAHPDAVVYVCTNLHGAAVVEAAETEIGLPVLDSVAVTLAACLAMAGADPVPPRWGRRLSHLAGHPVT